MPTPTPLPALPAAVPILLLVFLLVGVKWSAVRASLAGLAAAAAIAAAAYRASGGHIAVEALKGAWSSVSIVIVILPAVLIHEISAQAGAYPAIRRELARLVPDRLLQTLALGWCFASFLQGPSGFGVPVAVAAPLLVAIGVKPLWAVAIPLLGHGWANTFGTLALAWDALFQQVEATPEIVFAAAGWAGLFLFLMNALAGVFICRFHNGSAGVRHGLPAVVILGLIMGGGQAALAPFLPSLATVIPTAAALCAAPLLARLRRYSGNAPEASPIMEAVAAEHRDQPRKEDDLTPHQALLPYYALTGISLAVLSIPPLKAFLGQWTTAFSFPGFVTGLGFVSAGTANHSPVAWFTHSGVFLLGAALLATWRYTAKGRLPRKEMGTVLLRTWRKAVPASLSVTLLVAMSAIMAGTGQTDAVARAVAGATGKWYGVLSPLVGGAGAFISSSNVGSNVLFGQFQFAAASLTGFDVAVVLAAQTAGGALGCVVSPSRVMLGAATAGGAGSEGAIIGKLAGPTVLCVAVIGALAMALG